MMRENSLFEYPRDITDLPMLSLSDANETESHFHRQMEILYIVEGKYRVCINGEEQILEPNQLVIADSYDVHSYQKITPKATSIALIISHSTLREYNGFKKNHVLSKNFITDNTIAQKCKQFIDFLFPFWEHKSQKMNGITSHICQGLLMYIAEEIGFVEKPISKSAELDADVLRYVLENLYSPTLTLEFIADKFGYSKYYFSKRFLKTFKVPFNYYLNILRARDALYLIQVKKYSVLDAALHVGFNSQATFYRFVKQHFKDSPKNIELTP